MKGIDIFCASQAATSICLSMEPSSSSSPSSSINLLGSQSPAIDRYNPIIRDSTRIPKQPFPSHPPTLPKPHKNHHKKKNKKIPLKEKNVDQPKNNNKNDDNNNNNNIVSVRKSWSCSKPSEFISPPGSTRYLLSNKLSADPLNYGDNKVFFNAAAAAASLSDLDPARKEFTAETSNSKPCNTNESWDDKNKPSSGSIDQVVVLRVSLHCRGCERKMRKHISRMQGVTSFNIDFMAKKVTVTGNVTPLEVLSSISKVKNAQLWSQSVSSSTPPTLANLNNPDLNKEELVLKL
ncbi:hypothetical protein BUALT_Bualt09G0066600 [Buddleja alternifolia]|uniref:HMA domain-containing protein n=1 Tax=Buddleja alternifolia TaxID=168488 RepID=A0AAV6X1R0_9LAMI|nr:hypothetical protein BUALT_Bualt09G0066600 [Buddleja alternifolia]